MADVLPPRRDIPGGQGWDRAGRRQANPLTPDPPVARAARTLKVAKPWIIWESTHSHTHTCAGTNKKTTDRERSGERC